MEALARLREHYAEGWRGVVLREVAGGFTLATDPVAEHAARRLLARPRTPPLTQAQARVPGDRGLPPARVAARGRAHPRRRLGVGGRHAARARPDRGVRPLAVRGRSSTAPPSCSSGCSASTASTSCPTRPASTPPRSRRASCASACSGPASSAPPPRRQVAVPSFREQREIARALGAASPALERLEPGAGHVALTFDDGPDPDGTPAVLDALEAAGAPATFFMLGEQLMRNTSLGREVAVRGHEIALHGFGHAATRSSRPRGARRPRARARSGRGCHRPRPVSTGRRTAASASTPTSACAALGLRPVYWSAWGEDWEASRPARIAELVSRDLADAAIVLLHDSPVYADRPSAEPTAAGASPRSAQRARDAGLSLRLASARRSVRRARAS